MGRRMGIGRLGQAGALALLFAGCVDAEVISAGSEGNAINLARCFGADCAAQPESLSPGGDEPGEPCAVADELLEQPLVAKPPELYQLSQIEIGDDGLIWALMRLGGEETYALARFDLEGTLIGTSDIIAKAGDDKTLSLDLAVDGHGNAVVAVYSVQAASADDEPLQRLTVLTYDPGMRPVGEPLVFQGLAETEIIAGGASFLLAGNALANGANGVLASVDNRELQWIQTNVPSSGTSAGVGVSAIARTPSANIGVLSLRSPRWSGGPDVYQFGISTFDQNGEPAWDLELPTQYAGGYRAELATTPSGEFVVVGRQGDDGIVVRQVESRGTLGWSYRLRSYDAVVAIAQDGRSIVSTSDGLGVISADGQVCTEHVAPPASTYYRMPSDVAIFGEYLFMATQYDLLRYRLPSE